MALQAESAEVIRSACWGRRTSSGTIRPGRSSAIPAPAPAEIRMIAVIVRPPSSPVSPCSAVMLPAAALESNNPPQQMCRRTA